MDLDNLKQAWQKQEKQLQNSWKLNLELLRTINLDKAKSRMDSLTRITAITLVFYLGSALLFAFFAVQNIGKMQFVLSGGLLAFWASLIASGSMRQLGLIAQIDYSEPIPVLQKKLETLKLVILRYLRLGVWILPFYMAFVVIGFKVLLGIDIIAFGDTKWLIVQAMLSIAFIPLTIWLYKKLSPENINKEWVNTLLKGAGSQISDALECIKKIEQFEEN
ncbi:MAG: hypothetical protein ACRBF0_16455 [Calditrichia bacterium]